MENNWEVKKLNNVAKINMGQSPSSETYNREGDGLPFFQGNAEFSDLHPVVEKWCNDPKKIAHKNDILISVRAPVGALNIANKKCCIGRGLSAITFDGNKKYLFYYLKRATNELKGKGTGSTFKSISGKILKELKVPYPPKPVQNKIVEKIEKLFSDLDNGIGNLQKAKKQLETYKQSVLKAAFEGNLTSAWREQQDELPTPEELKQHIDKEQERYRQQQLKEWEQEVKEWKEQGGPAKKPRKPMKGRTFDPLDEELENLPNLPSNWEWIRISDTVSRVEYGTSQKSEDSGEVPVLRMGNMQGGKFVWDDLAYSNDPEEIEKYLLKPGDVLFNRTNSPELVGKTALYKGKQKAIFAGYLIRLNQIDTIVDTRYLNYYLNSYEAQNYGNKVKTDGVNQSNINGTKLSGYPFPYTSLKEQKKIADEIEFRFSIVDQNKRTIEQELQKAEALRQSILKKAFSGKLIQEERKIEKESVPSDEELIPFNQMQMIGILIDTLEKEFNMAYGEMALAKYLYLIDRIKKYRTGLKYKDWHWGPYDPSMKGLIYKKDGFFQIGQKSTIQIKEGKRETLLKYDLYDRELFEEGIREISQIIGRFEGKKSTSRQLELLATACKVIENVQSTDLKIVRNGMEKWDTEKGDFKNKAAKFSRKETKRCLSFILKKEWEKKLII